ncbi:programmed cell death protein 2, partial [Pilobolus umbonatus]
MGDVWGTNAGFGTSQSGGFGMKSNTSIQRNKVKSVEEELVKKMNVLSVVTHPVNTDTLPRFPGHYLYIDEENLNNYESMGIDLSRYKQYLDMEEQLLMELDEPEGEGWQGETYEKQNLPRGVDKQFKKFTERVECEPTQCVRYEYKGTPLLYSALTQQQQDILNSKCKYCKCPRIFELQLMPNILSLLPTTEYAMADQDKIQSNMISNSWNVGMEFGTILIFSCQKDCHPGSMEEVTYAEESCIVQYEID